MKMRWLALGVAMVLITGGAATVAQRIITQKTRGVLPETNDPAHADSRKAAILVEPAKMGAKVPSPLPHLSLPLVAQTPSLADSPTTKPPEAPETPMAAEAKPFSPTDQPISPTVAVIEADLLPTNPPSDPPPAPSADPAISPATVQAVAVDATPEPSPAKADPVATVETFVERNRKEAESAIQTLTTEADNLKARLTKVEAALVRWQNFSRALNADQPAAQPDGPVINKPNWKRIAPDLDTQPVKTTRTEEPIPPAPVVTPETSSAEVPANPPVPSADEPPVPVATEPTPADKPGIELPSPKD